MSNDDNHVRVLLIDDDPGVIRGYEKALGRHGAILTTATNGREATDRVKEGAFDVIVSDVSMPQMTGIEFLKAVRAHDLDVPVILITGDPSVESAARAVEYGAFRYLSKPILPSQLWEVVLHASRMHALARLKRQALELPGRPTRGIADRAALEVRFSWARGLMWMAFQPIVSFGERRVIGYEALLRSEEPLMRNPAEMLDAAERLGLLRDLGRSIRAKVASAADAPEAAHAKIFLNLHAEDLEDEELYDDESPVSKIAHRVVLEITERASLHGIVDVKARIRRLKERGFQIALDDLGAGYAGLTSFAQIEPDVAKLDMSLVRGIDGDSRLQSIVRSMKTLCDDLGVVVVSEGVETAGERDTLVALGCDLFQGYLFGRPGRGFEAPRF